MSKQSVELENLNKVISQLPPEERQQIEDYYEGLKIAFAEVLDPGNLLMAMNKCVAEYAAEFVEKGIVDPLCDKDYLPFDRCEFTSGPFDITSSLKKCKVGEWVKNGANSYVRRYYGEGKFGRWGIVQGNASVSDGEALKLCIKALVEEE